MALEEMLREARGMRDRVRAYGDESAEAAGDAYQHMISWARRRIR